MKQTNCVLFGFMFHSCCTHVFERIALLRRIWQVRLTFCARYQDLHLVPCKCQQKHMWPVLGLWVWRCLNTHAGLSLYVFSTTQPSKTWLEIWSWSNHQRRALRVDPTFLAERPSITLGTFEYHGSRGRGGTGVPVPSGTLGGFVWTETGDHLFVPHSINIMNQKSMIMFDLQVLVIPGP